jgi:hypothetical protein
VGEERRDGVSGEAAEPGGAANGGGDLGAIAGATRENERGRGDRGEGVTGLAGVFGLPLSAGRAQIFSARRALSFWGEVDRALL